MIALRPLLHPIVLPLCLFFLYVTPFALSLLQVDNPFCVYHYVAGSVDCCLSLSSVVFGRSLFVLVVSNEIRCASRLCFSDANISWYHLHMYLANVDLTRGFLF